VDTLQAMAEKFPHLAQTLATQIAALMMSGSILQLDTIAEQEHIDSEEL